MKNHESFDENSLEHNDEYLTEFDNGVLSENDYEFCEIWDRIHEIKAAQNDLSARHDA